MITDIVEPASGGTPQGYVVLLHGLAANKRIMSYLAQGFSEEGLRVFVPDLPGHGRTAGDFSYQRADECSGNLTRELAARGLLDPERTMLAGHSLGGAIALRVASRFPVAGVIAISPAPMHPIRGIPPEAIPFSDFPAIPPNSLVLEGEWESAKLRDAALDLVRAGKGGTNQYIVVPHATHVSILFNRIAMTDSQNWAARALHSTSPAPLPSHRSLLGFFLGLAGILLLSGPFLREILQTEKKHPPQEAPPTDATRARALLDYAILGLGAVAVLSFGNPLRALHVFEGDYFAAFLLIFGPALLLLRWRSLPGLLRPQTPDDLPRRPLYVTLLLSAFAALLLYLLFTAWTDLTLSEAWLTQSRWLRFIPFFVAALPYHAAEELILGSASGQPAWQRLLFALSLRFVAWVTLVFGIFVFHSGQVLLVLLIPFLAVFCLLQAWAIQVVRDVTASPTASAIFGAILLAGFCLVAFPTT